MFRGDAEFVPGKKELIAEIPFVPIFLALDTLFAQNRFPRVKPLNQSF